MDGSPVKEKRKLIALGGPRHGETVEVEGTNYLDIATGTVYLVRETVAQLVEGSFARDHLVHETIVSDPQQTQGALTDAVLTAHFREGRPFNAPDATPQRSALLAPTGAGDAAATLAALRANGVGAGLPG
jgi:hypothetical protein